ncbi:TIGR00725 family protein [Desulfobacca acetoxidans]|uniref:TIGR00725 family protein n=1 Tax=Desulfobacca acetoxidans (strain ATCC 700848 / DSM 11109 / ASRB2) TaxID=880072 RepID=F2ND79_DESAR|nr:TIGR00725 family protein [Desulfobacca acetoxidans]AEB09803.1 Conserved hypothetical protein CHP00725 [Desulfobacca acetoxidans DSM 11109]
MISRTPPVYIAVIGGSKATGGILPVAWQIGQEIARRGAVLLCGGLGGVMSTAARGAQEAGGVSIGILPGPDRQDANPYLTYSLPTNLGHARNVLIAHSADGLIAVDGEYGTISEAAIALKLGKPVVGLSVTWRLEGVAMVTTSQEAVDLILQRIKKCGV